MKDLFALVFKNNGLIFRIVDEVEETDESVTTVTYSEPNPNNFGEVVNEETGLVENRGVDNTPSSKRNYKVIQFKFNEETSTVESFINDENEEVTLNRQLNEKEFWKLNNNGLYWKNNEII